VSSVGGSSTLSGKSSSSGSKTATQCCQEREEQSSGFLGVVEVVVEELEWGRAGTHPARLAERCKRCAKASFRGAEQQQMPAGDI
jgi:hypothetical protein